MTVLQLTGRRLRPAWLFLFAAAVLFLTPSVHAQSASNPHSTVTGAALGINNSGFIDATATDQGKNRMLRNMAQQRNDLRQKAIVDDADELLDLARQLKTAVDESNKDELSLKVLDTASQIEKLAKTVEKKMRGAD